MLISKKWIQECVRIPADVSDTELAQRITRSTVEVESVQDQAKALEHIVVGVIASVSAHPNADKLRVCQVDVGGSALVQIVCGGSNVVPGMKVAVALAGAWVKWHGEGDLVEIKNTKLRGEVSEGMICSSVEIGLSPTEADHEVRNLGAIDAPAGTPLASALGLDDVIFDIEHKSLTNRPDLMGHYGMAREVAALTKATFAPYKSQKIPSGKGFEVDVRVEDTDACLRYMAVALEGVEVGASPVWMQQRLTACGIRSINTVVDVTNYVMLELGQPMHAFDADVLGQTIVVRKAQSGEKIVALDEKTYALDSEMLMITNGTTPMAIAGVMGGQGSGVSQTTTRIVLEAAAFDAVSVRKTSTKLGLRSESSSRFEKSLDPALCAQALARAVELMMQVCPQARVVSRVMDVYPNPSNSLTVSVSVDRVNTVLGTRISEKDMLEILTRLGFKVQAKKQVLTVTIPSWRATKDVQIVEDVIEEIARVWGYDNIEATLPAFLAEPPAQDSMRPLIRNLRTQLSIGQGMQEVYRYAFVSPEVLQMLGFALEDHLKLANPLAEDRPYLCRSLIPNLLETVLVNQRAVSVVSVFEIARVFLGSTSGAEDGQGGMLPAQPHHLAMAYSAHDDQVPIIALRRMVQLTLEQMNLEVSFQENTESASWMHSARSAHVLVNGVVCGVLAEVNPTAAQQMGIDRKTAVVEVDLLLLVQQTRHETVFTPIPAFPDAKRDLAFTVPERTPAVKIEEAVRSASNLLVHYELFDLYRGKGVPEGQKSIAVHFTFRSLTKTLESKEVDDEMQKIVHVLEKEFGAILRV